MKYYLIYTNVLLIHVQPSHYTYTPFGDIPLGHAKHIARSINTLVLHQCCFIAHIYKA